MWTVAPDTSVERARFSHSSGLFGVTDAGGVSPVIAAYVAPCASEAPVPACGFTTIQHGTGPAMIGRKIPVRIAPTAFHRLAESTHGKSQWISRSTAFAASTSSGVGSSGTSPSTNPGSGARYVHVTGSYPSSAPDRPVQVQDRALRDPVQRRQRPINVRPVQHVAHNRDRRILRPFPGDPVLIDLHRDPDGHTVHDSPEPVLSQGPDCRSGHTRPAPLAPARLLVGRSSAGRLPL